MENGTSAGSVPAERRPQEDGEEQTGQSDLRQNEQREELPQQRRRDQHGQQVQGTGEIVGIQRQVADAHARLAQVLQRAARSGAFPGTRRRRGNTDATCRAPAPAGRRTATGRRARSTAASRRTARRTTGRDSGASAACGQFSAWEGLLCAMRRRSWGIVASKLTPYQRASGSRRVSAMVSAT